MTGSTGQGPGDPGFRNVVIVGAGAMGCLFAARLAESGLDVTLVDVDERRIAAINDNGIALHDDSGARVVRLRASLAHELDHAPDLLILFTKTIHTRTAVQSIAHLAGPQTYALTLQNGLGNAEALLSAFDSSKVLHGITTVPSNLDGPASVSSHGTGYVKLGPFVPSGTQGARRVAAALNAASLTAIIEDRIEIAIWEKAAFNAALNPLGALTGLANGGLANAAGRQIAFAVVQETVAVARSKGILLDCERVVQQVDLALVSHADHKASMLQDRLGGRPTEIEAINGAIARAGEDQGVPCAVTSTLANLIRLLDGSDRVQGGG